MSDLHQAIQHSRFDFIDCTKTPNIDYRRREKKTLLFVCVSEMESGLTFFFLEHIEHWLLLNVDMCSCWCGECWKNNKQVVIHHTQCSVVAIVVAFALIFVVVLVMVRRSFACQFRLLSIHHSSLSSPFSTLVCVLSFKPSSNPTQSCVQQFSTPTITIVHFIRVRIGFLAHSSLSTLTCVAIHFICI